MFILFNKYSMKIQNIKILSLMSRTDLIKLYSYKKLMFFAKKMEKNMALDNI